MADHWHYLWNWTRLASGRDGYAAVPGVPDASADGGGAPESASCLLLAPLTASVRLHIDGRPVSVCAGHAYMITPGTTYRLDAQHEQANWYVLSFSRVSRAAGASAGRVADGRSDGGGNGDGGNDGGCGVGGGCDGNGGDSGGSALERGGALACHPLSRCHDLLAELCALNAEPRNAMNALRGDLLLHKLLWLLAERNSPGALPADEGPDIQRSIDYIHAHYTLALTVDELADQARCDRWRYTQCFKQTTGATPLDYIHRLRMDKAKRLLRTTGCRLSEVAETSGFSNEYYFSRRFKRSEGLTPGQYRRIHERQNPRVLAPFLEDFLIALGIEPVAQIFHKSWGAQRYLGLQHVPILDIEQADEARLGSCKPELIVLDGGAARWNLDSSSKRVAATWSLRPTDWRQMLWALADLFGKTEQAQQWLDRYEHKASAARELLLRAVSGQTVVMLRVSAGGLSVYNEKRGYCGPVLYGDLRLTPHWLASQTAQTSASSRLAPSALNPEQLSLLDADHLFVTFDYSEGECRGLLETEAWRRLPAVRAGRVYEVDFFSWMNYGILSNFQKIDDVLQKLVGR